MFDDNTSPALAFEWSTGLKRSPGTDVTCCHLYAQSVDPEAYTDLRNLFYAPSFISKLTDSQAVSLPASHALNILRYRAFVLFGYCGPASTTRPSKPEHYDQLKWADTVGTGITAAGLETRLRGRLARKPKDRLTKSVAECGWTFSDGRSNIFRNEPNRGALDIRKPTLLGPTWVRKQLIFDWNFPFPNTLKGVAATPSSVDERFAARCRIGAARHRIAIDPRGRP